MDSVKENRDCSAENSNNEYPNRVFDMVINENLNGDTDPEPDAHIALGKVLVYHSSHLPWVLEDRALYIRKREPVYSDRQDE
ncbi:MAG: hypothetical protein SVK08_00205 [Halobacteriota archaeon]|nr:hypothetical protein [Halobacteriota archaeon]